MGRKLSKAEKRLHARIREAGERTDVFLARWEVNAVAGQAHQMHCTAGWCLEMLARDQAALRPAL